MNNTKKRLDRDKIFDIFSYVILTIILLLVAYPLYFIIIASISDPAKVSAGAVTLLPTGINLDGYKAILEKKEVITGFINALWYTVLGTSINLIVTLPAAFALSRKDLKGRNILTIFFTIPMFISGGMIPTYLVVKQLNMLDTVWALVLPVALNIYNLIIARTFFQASIDAGIYEAAKIDGCGNTRFFFSIALPLSKAIIAILVLYYGVAHWNSYFSALIYILDKEKFPLQLVLRSILVQSQQQSQMVQDFAELQRNQQVAELMKYSLIIVSSIPVMILYPFIQKHFVKGVMIGSIKG